MVDIIKRAVFTAQDNDVIIAERTLKDRTIKLSVEDNTKNVDMYFEIDMRDAEKLIEALQAVK